MSFLRDRRHILLLSFIVLTRVALIAYVYPDRAKMFNGDSDLYDGLAVNLVEEGRYYFDPYEPRSDLIRTPGFPLFIAANYLVFGTNPISVILWNIFFVVAIYLLIFKLLHRLKAHATFAPAFILSLDLAWLLYSKELLTEPLFTSLLLLVLLLLIKPRGDFNLGNGVAAGALLGLAALVKPIVLYLPVFLIVYLLARRTKPVTVMAFGVAFLVLVAPWFIRNNIKHDSYTFTSIQSHNLLFAHGAFVYADANDLTHRAAQDGLFELLEERLGTSHDEAPFNQVEQEEERLAAEVLASHPVLYAKAIIRGMAVTLFDPGRLVFSRTFSTSDSAAIGLTNIVASEGVVGAFNRLVRMNPVMVTILLIYLAFLIAVTAIACLGVMPFFRRSPGGVALITLVLLYLLVLGGPNGYARFRLYIFPLLLIYADFGWSALRVWISKRSRARSLARASSA